MTNRIMSRSHVAAIACMLVSACATLDDGMNSADLLEARKCRSGETYSCIERLGRPVRCFCADKDALRELLEPTVE